MEEHLPSMCQALGAVTTGTKGREIEKPLEQVPTPCGHYAWFYKWVHGGNVGVTEKEGCPWHA